MPTEMTRMGANGRIVVPAAFRKAMGLKPGVPISLSMDEYGLHVQSVRQTFECARAVVRKHYGEDGDPVRGLLADRREDAVREASE